MTSDISTQFSFTRFKQDLIKKDKRRLLSWANCELYVAFYRNASGQDLPGLIQVDSQQRYVASSSQDTLKKAMTNIKLEDDSEIVIKTLSLAELARNAHFYHLSIHLIDQDDGLAIGGVLMQLLGITAILEDAGGKEVIYEADVFSFEPEGNAETLPYGAVQYWRDIALEYTPDREPSEINSLYVFDDQLDWDNPLFPELPDNAKALSKLSSSAKAFFEHMRVPPLTSWEEKSATPDVPEPSYQNSLLGVSKLSTFNVLRAMVDQDIVPVADDIALTITKDSAHDDEPADSAERWEVKISFTTPMGFNAVFDPDWIEASLCKANTELPDTTGTHLASEKLRERIVNHLAWNFFQHGRSFVKTLFSTDLQGLLPGFIVNSYGPFQPDYTDERFPCLARFKCGENGVPVLLLGPNEGNYVCMPLAFEEIPESDVSPLIPRRSELISIESKSMPLAERYERLVIPASLIDFPDHWYQGIRVSNRYLKTKFIFGMHLNSLINEMGKDRATTAGNSLKWVVAGCAAAALIGVMVVMNL